MCDSSELLMWAAANPGPAGWVATFSIWAALGAFYAYKAHEEQAAIRLATARYARDAGLDTSPPPGQDLP